MSDQEIDDLSVEDPVEIASELMRAVAVRDAGLLAAAPARPNIRPFGEDAYRTFEEKAAAPLQSLVRNHALADGNTRLAWSATRVFCLVNGRHLTYTVDGAEEMMLEAAAGGVDVSKIFGWIAARIGPAS